MAQKFGLRWHRDCNNRQSFGKGRFWKAFIRNQAKNNRTFVSEAMNFMTIDAFTGISCRHASHLLEVCSKRLWTGRPTNYNQLSSTRCRTQAKYKLLNRGRRAAGIRFRLTWLSTLVTRPRADRHTPSASAGNRSLNLQSRWARHSSSQLSQMF